MINLGLQIYSIIYTYLYGILCSLLVNLFYRFLFFKKQIWKIIFNLGFAFLLSSLYFFFLELINHGYIHFYFLLVFILGFLTTFSLFKKNIRK